MKRSLIIFILIPSFAFLLFNRGDRRKTVLRQPFSKARQALDMLSAARSYPDNIFPSSGVALAFNYSRDKLRRKDRIQNEEPWEAIGPRNIGGRTLDVALNPMNPNTIYAGSASGGLWRSYCGGVGNNAWELINTGFPVRAGSSIAIAPDDSNTIYMGTGEVYGSEETFPGIVGERTTRGSYGIGILKTVDGGQTWQKSLDWILNQRRGVQRVRINPLRFETIYAATTEGAYRSYNGGDAWALVLDVVMATDIAINPLDTSIVYVACGGMGSTGRGIYRTVNGGNDWELAEIDASPSQGDPSQFQGKIRLGMSRSSPNIVYASIGLSDGSLFGPAPTGTWLVKTIDDGETWEVVSIRDYSRIQGWYAHDVTVHPEDPDIVWCAGQVSSENPLLSVDGGRNLVRAVSLGLFNADPETASRNLPHNWADYHAIVFHPSDPQTIYFANDGGVFRTTDGGATVTNCNLGYQVTQFYNGISNSQNDPPFIIGGLQDNGSVAYDGDPDNWRRILGGDGSWTAMNQNNGSTVYASWQFLNMGRNNSRGVGAFLSITPPRNTVVTNFIAPFILSADNATVYAGSNVIFKSINGGINWTTTNGGNVLDGNPALSMAGSHQSPEVVYVATSPTSARAGVFRTRNGGGSWQNITGTLPDRYPMDLAVDPNSDKIVYIVLGGFGISHAYKSENGGDSWAAIGGALPDLPTWAVTVDPLQPDHVYVGNEIGVYVSADGGSTWNEYIDGLPDAVIAMDLSISNGDRMLIVATHGNGMYQRPLLSPATTISDVENLPQDIVLEQNYPNPFNPDTKIRYFLKHTENVELFVYNISGQLIRSLVDSKINEGWHVAAWDGKTNSGRQVASGVYLYQLRTGRSVLNRKMMLVR